MKNPFSDLTRPERWLYMASAAVIIAGFLASGGKDVLSLIASLVGVTALIFVAKGYVLGQVLTVVFAVFYGMISFSQRYYGEMITYLCMTAPIAAAAVISWARHPYKGTKTVEVATPSGRALAVMAALTVLVTAAFYFILRALGNASLGVSTLSVATSFAASYLTWLRSPFYALAYAANDVVLIVLWVIAAAKDMAYLPIVLCFAAFLANDLYGFYNWQRMKEQQSGKS